MAPRTRSVTSSPVKKSIVGSPALEDPEQDGLKLLIAPKCLSTESKFLPLKHPTNGLVKIFLFCPQNGLFELKKSKFPLSDPRSIFLVSSNTGDTDKSLSEQGNGGSVAEGYIKRDAEIVTATPYDLAFIFLRTIAPQNTVSRKSLFQPAEDLLESVDDEDKSFDYILNHGQPLVHTAMSAICDTVDAGGENMYRYNEEKVFKYIIGKAESIAESGLPASLEDRFVTRLLEPPILSVRREDTTISLVASAHTETRKSTSPDDSFDSESVMTSSTTSTTFSEISTSSTILTVPEETVSTEVRRLQTIRVAYNFISATCLPLYVATRLTPLLSGATSPIDFTPLEDYLKHLAVLQAEAAASRSISDFSRKRGIDEHEAAEERADKKRKLEEEEKRKKANESRGVRDLKKVNVTGMKKMSDFFTRKPSMAITKT